MTNKLIVLLGAFFVASCGSLSMLTSTIGEKDANWEYVKSYWGGIKGDKVVRKENFLELQFTLMNEDATKIDSALCPLNSKLFRRENSIFLSIKYGLCRHSDSSSLSATIELAAHGRYIIKYEDSKADYPIIGEFEL